MKTENLEEVIQELVGEVSNFNINFILESNSTEESVREVYTFLKSKVLSDSKIDDIAELLRCNPHTLQQKHQHKK